MNNHAPVTVSPPKNEQAEYDLIGAILIDPDLLPALVGTLEPADFTNEVLARIWEAMLTLARGRRRPTPSTILGELMRLGYPSDTIKGVYGGPASYMTKCAEPFVFGIADERIADEYAREIQRTSQLRKLIEVGGTIAASGFDQGKSVLELLAQSETALGDIKDGVKADAIVPVSQAGERELDRLDAIGDRADVITGISTGISRLDTNTGGLQDGALFVLASRPGMGKTTMAMNIAMKVAEQGKRVCIFSLEMTEAELLRKMACMKARVVTEAVKSNRLDDAERSRYVGAVGLVSSLPILIVDKTNVTITELPALVDQCRQRYGLDLLIVDYLQLVKGTKNKNWNREQEVAEIARGLKEIALSRQIPVLACCQLNRQVEARSSKVPELADLRESGEIEQAADIVGLLYREEAYDQEAKEPNTATLFIRKNRSGPVGYVKMFCDMQYGIFGNLAMYGAE